MPAAASPHALLRLRTPGVSLPEVTKTASSPEPLRGSHPPLGKPPGDLESKWVIGNWFRPVQNANKGTLPALTRPNVIPISDNVSCQPGPCRRPPKSPKSVRSAAFEPLQYNETKNLIRIGIVRYKNPKRVAPTPQSARFHPHGRPCRKSEPAQPQK